MVSSDNAHERVTFVRDMARFEVAVVLRGEGGIFTVCWEVAFHANHAKPDLEMPITHAMAAMERHTQPA